MTALLRFLFVASLLAAACGGSDQAVLAQGAPATLGAPEAGLEAASPGSGGSTAAGGAAGSSYAITGGELGSGGSSSTGGSAGTGGDGSGGTTALAGHTGTGGSSATGGATGTGGQVNPLPTPGQTCATPWCLPEGAPGNTLPGPACGTTCVSGGSALPGPACGAGCDAECNSCLAGQCKAWPNGRYTFSDGHNCACWNGVLTC